MRAYFLMLGLPDMATQQMLFLVIIVTAAFALGWIAGASPQAAAAIVSILRGHDAAADRRHAATLAVTQAGL